MRLWTFALLGAVAIACSSDGDGDAANANGPGSDLAACAESKNDEVRLRLAPACVGCHGEGASRPFFASLTAFESALVYDTRYVTPGKPAESYLMQLLRGQGPGAFKQMPPNSEPFSALADSGKTGIRVAELEDWIKDLPPPGPHLSKPDRAAVTTRRLTAEEIVKSLQGQLGLTQADFVRSDNPNILVDSALPIWPADSIAPSLGSYETPPNGWPRERFTALGGPNTLEYQQRENGVTPSMMQVLIQISQRWCGMSVAKKDSPLFRHASAADTATAAPDKVRRNLEYMQLRMLGQTDKTEEDGLFNLFLKYEPEGADVAWIAACASLVRHPRWISF